MRDDSERRLAARLHAYESRVPDADPPSLESVRPGPPLPAVVGGGILAAVAAGLLAVVLLQPISEAVGDASPTPVASPAPSTLLSPPPSTPSMAPPTPEPTGGSETPVPTPGAVGRWAPVGTFASEGWAEEVVDMTYAAGHFIAVGYREPDDTRGEVGLILDEQRIWLSADGRTWEGPVADATFEGAHFTSVVALADGSAAIYGYIQAADDGSPIVAAWHSTDGGTWTPLVLDLPRDELLGSVTAGAQGALTVVRSSETETVEIWHSVDGATFTVTHVVEARDGLEPGVNDWNAGPEGFVVTGYRYRFVGEAREEQAFAVASGDGRTWFEADAELTPSPTYTLVTPIGGDWMIVGNEDEGGSWTGRASTWHSSNGLGWEERASIEVPVPTFDPQESVGSLVGSLVSTGERVIASGSVVICCHGPRWAAGVWSSFDGRTWERLGFPDGTVVNAAAEHDGVVVLAGSDQARPEDEFRTRAMFWIGERN